MSWNRFTWFPAHATHHNCHTVSYFEYVTFYSIGQDVIVSVFPTYSQITKSTVSATNVSPAAARIGWRCPELTWVPLQLWINEGRFPAGWGDESPSVVPNRCYRTPALETRGPSLSLSSQGCCILTLAVPVILEGEYERLVRSYRLSPTCHLSLRWIGWGAGTDLVSPL